ncbi:MAG TPA: ribose 5-phosphate isomerase B [Tissierellaceae bacterium]|nr:ribose 5-phosphate isomerase B [Tissierellaceae bacterium]
MRIGIGSDHGGYELKESIKEYLTEEGIEFIDYGTNSLESVDYPDFGKAVSNAVLTNEVDRGILICGTGIGISISANRNKGIRCALCTDSYSARMSRMHNNANILALGGRVLGVGLALNIVNTFLETEFEGGRHERRINKIDEITC